MMILGGKFLREETRGIIGKMMDRFKSRQPFKSENRKRGR